MKYLLILITCSLLLITSLQAGQLASTVIEADLKASPSIKSKTLKILETDTPVNIVERQGGWYRVETAPPLQGWLKMLWLRYSLTGSEQGGFSLLTQGTGSVTVATGVRGLSEEELEKGQGDPFAINTLDRFIVSPEQARAFAKAEGLKQTQLPYVETK